MSRLDLNPQLYTIYTLLLGNVMNYSDRYCVAGILNDLGKEFEIGNQYLGLLQTAFTIAYMTFAPLCGFCGDRYSRRKILIGSVSLWTLAVLCGSFATDYMQFFVTRIFIGIGQASFSTIAPTIIYDVAPVKYRKNMLAVFYLGIPLGAGFGFILISIAHALTKSWRMSLRIPAAIDCAVIILLVFVRDPIRGEREQLEQQVVPKEMSHSCKKDLANLLRTKSFVLATFGYTCATFVTGALIWWAPSFLHKGFILVEGKQNMAIEPVLAIFGAMAFISGLIGVPMGSIISTILSPTYPTIDPFICAFSLLINEPIVIAVLILTNRQVLLTYALIFVGEVFLNMIWSILADIVMSVVVPNIRSTAQAIQITFSHAFGDAVSPYLVGLLSEVFSSESYIGKHDKKYQDFYAMRLALTCIIFVQLVGGVAFIVNAYYIVQDRKVVVEKIIQGV